jgi:hypothetical protein
MAPKLDRQVIRVAVANNKSEPSCLVFADGILVAVISHLEETVEGELKHRWYLEAGFGPCDGVIPHPIFASKEEAWAWVSARTSAA